MVIQWIKRILLYLGILLIFIFGLYDAFYFYCIRIPGESYSGTPPELNEQLQASRDRLHGHVEILATEIGERHAGKPKSLEQAAQYIEDQFRDMLYVPKLEQVNEMGHRNILVDQYGTRQRDKIIVIGAHYDTVYLTPGADDNASGVAALLEVARAFSKYRPPVTIRFVAFVNEEFPYYGTDDMGSLFNARRTKERNENIIGMFSLEMVGYYSDAARSQYYPRVLRRFYPGRGNYIGFVGNLMSRELLHGAITSFRKEARLPSEGLVAPQILVRDIRRSDNASFWFHGIPAVMITDTSNYRNENYHNIADTPNTLDYDRMARLVEGLIGMLNGLAESN